MRPSTRAVLLIAVLASACPLAVAAPAPPTSTDASTSCGVANTGTQTFNGPVTINCLPTAALRDLVQALQGQVDDLEELKTTQRDLIEQLKKKIEALGIEASSEPITNAATIDGRALDWGNWLGRVFFHAPDGDYACSGVFVAPNIVLTGAHCVRDANTGEFYKDIVFALPGTKGSRQIYGAILGSQCVMTYNEWMQGGTEKYESDFAAIRVNRSISKDYPIIAPVPTAVVPAFSINMSTGEAIYGKVAPAGNLLQFRPRVPGLSPGTGGPLLTNENGVNYLLGIVSFSFADQPDVSYGPRLGGRLMTLVEHAQKGCAGDDGTSNN